MKQGIVRGERQEEGHKALNPKTSVSQKDSLKQELPSVLHHFLKCAVYSTSFSLPLENIWKQRKTSKMIFLENPLSGAKEATVKHKGELFPFRERGTVKSPYKHLNHGH